MSHYQVYIELEFKKMDGCLLSDAEIKARLVHGLGKDGLAEFDLMDAVFGENLDTLDYSTWSTYHQDMIDITKTIPDVLVTLSGKGDDDDDLWKTYYLNGLYQEEFAVITYGDFDPLKLDMIKDIHRYSVHTNGIGFTWREIDCSQAQAMVV